MDLGFMVEYAVPVIVGICLCIGYMLKHCVTTDSINKYIPALMGVIGIALNVWINMGISPEIMLGGMFSGLASTGLHQAFKQIVNKENIEK